MRDGVSGAESLPIPRAEGAHAGPRRARGTCAVQRALVSGLLFSLGMALLSGVALGSLPPASGTLRRAWVDTRMAGK